MNLKKKITASVVLLLTVLASLLYAQDIQWRVRCTTKGCGYTTDWNGDKKVVQQWADHHARINSGHSPFVEGKGKK